MRSQVSVDITLLFTSLVIIAVYAFTTFFFISNTDNVRIGMGREQWRNEAVSIANQIVYSPNCLGYVRGFVSYHNDSGGQLTTAKVNVPNAIDANKLDINRLANCLRMLTPEFRIFFEVQVEDDSGVVFSGANLDKNIYFTPSTFERVTIPVKIIYDDHISYGNVLVGVSANLDYFKTRIV